MIRLHCWLRLAYECALYLQFELRVIYFCFLLFFLILIFLIDFTFAMTNTCMFFFIFCLHQSLELSICSYCLFVIIFMSNKCYGYWVRYGFDNVEMIRNSLRVFGKVYSNTCIYKFVLQINYLHCLKSKYSP